MNEVAIVGFGPVGATLALLLREQGIRSLIIERDAGRGGQTRAAARR